MREYPKPLQILFIVELSFQSILCVVALLAFAEMHFGKIKIDDLYRMGFILIAFGSVQFISMLIHLFITKKFTNIKRLRGTHWALSLLYLGFMWLGLEAKVVTKNETLAIYLIFGWPVALGIFYLVITWLDYQSKRHLSGY